MSEDAQPNFWSKVSFWRRPKPEENRWANYRVSIKPSHYGGTYINIVDKRDGTRIANESHTGSEWPLFVKWDVEELIGSHEKSRKKELKSTTRADKQKAKLREAGFDVDE